MKLFENYLEIIVQQSSLDFSCYSKATIERRLTDLLAEERIVSPEEFRQKFTTDNMFHMKLLDGLTVRYTTMFRDPAFYAALKQQVFPYLSTFNTIRILSAGCSTGEEAYSLAILLDECGLLENSEIIASDINPGNIQKAKRGTISPQRLREYSLNYSAGGGQANMGRYYSNKEGAMVFSDRLKSRIKFFCQDITKEEEDGEFDLILCRNVMIYFTAKTQESIIERFAGKLKNYGYFVHGIQEEFNHLSPTLYPIDKENRIYRKVCRL
ncbi:MAG: protein-glutamate O-methyltransferase CheR [Bacteroidia bacterium]